MSYTRCKNKAHEDGLTICYSFRLFYYTLCGDFNVTTFYNNWMTIWLINSVYDKKRHLGYLCKHNAELLFVVLLSANYFQKCDWQVCFHWKHQTKNFLFIIEIIVKSMENPILLWQFSYLFVYYFNVNRYVWETGLLWTWQTSFWASLRPSIGMECIREELPTWMEFLC